MPLFSEYIMRMDSIEAARAWFEQNFQIELEEGESLCYPTYFRSADKRILSIRIEPNREDDYDEHYIRYEAYDEKTPVVKITTEDPDDPVYHYAMGHPELFVPVTTFSAWLDREELYSGSGPIPQDVLERLRRAWVEGDF